MTDTLTVLERIAEDRTVPATARVAAARHVDRLRRLLPLRDRTAKLMAQVAVIRAFHGDYVNRAADMDWNRIKQHVAHDPHARTAAQRTYRSAIDTQIALAYADRDLEDIPAQLHALEHADPLTLDITNKQITRALDAAENLIGQRPARITDLRQQLDGLLPQITEQETHA